MTSVSRRKLTPFGVDAFDSRVPSTGVCDSTITDFINFVDIVSYD